MHIKIHSPLTEEDDVEKITSYDVERICADWQEQFGIDVADEFDGRNVVDLYQCKQTGLRFFSPATIAGSGRLYEQLQAFDWFYMPWKWEHERLSRRLKKGECVLEVGCATGAFIEKMNAAGYTVEGIELNAKAVDEAQAKGLPVSLSGLEEVADSKAGKFDVICSFQVLEHIPNSADFIRDCLVLLKSSGRLVISVPNNDSFLGYEDNLLDRPPHHMTQWNVGVFKAMETLFPVKLSHVSYEPLAAYHVDAYLKVCRRRLVGKSGLYRLFLNRVTLPVIRVILKLGLRNFCRGQSIYVEFVKL